MNCKFPYFRAIKRQLVRTLSFSLIHPRAWFELVLYPSKNKSHKIV